MNGPRSRGGAQKFSVSDIIFHQSISSSFSSSFRSTMDSSSKSTWRERWKERQGKQER